MTQLTELLQRGTNPRLAPEIRKRPPQPNTHCVVVTCMDTRINPYRLLNLREGEVHIMRNAGGIVTDDILRSLIISQRLLNTREILILQHTECGMCTFDGEEFKDELQKETGIRPPYDMGTFRDVYKNVRSDVISLRHNRLLRQDTVVYGLVYDVDSDVLVDVMR